MLKNDAVELLEQMELSIREIDDEQERQKNLQQLRHFKADLKLLENEFVGFLLIFSVMHISCAF